MVLPTSPKATTSVQVVVRLRPLNEREKKHGTLPVVSASTADRKVTVIKGTGSRQVKSSYKFDNIFTAFSSQEDVFEATLKPVIRDVLMGFESTVFAYGQTGTGKTHTMEGDLSDPQQHGVIPRSAAAIFEALKNPEYTDANIYCSFLEIYNEQLSDLLVEDPGINRKRPKLDIVEGKNGPFCRGLSEQTVDSAEQVLSLMRKAQRQRQVGETNMNKQSSRSHCIFTMRVDAKKKILDGSVLEVSGKLHCVDLAGSECAKSANLGKGNEDQSARERERLNINRSLLTLGRVISMLKEQSTGSKKKSVRIPYRDSKLTRILQESLGGRCKTCLIATVSPSVTAIEESMSTLNYAQAANGIVNKPITTSYMTHLGSSTLSDRAASNSNDGESHGAIEHWHEMECRLQYMQAQVDEAQHALARKHLQQQELVEKAERAENARAEAVTRCAEAEKETSRLKDEVQFHIEDKAVLTEKLDTAEIALEETTAILKATQQTEQSLTQEATTLLTALKKSISDGNGMYQVILSNREEDIQRKEATRNFRESVGAVFEDILKSMGIITSLEDKYIATFRENIQSSSHQQAEFFETYQSMVRAIADNVSVALIEMNRHVLGDSGILPSHVDASSSIQDRVNMLKDNLSDGTNNIQASCEAIHKKLSISSARLKEMEVGYDSRSEELLKAFSRSICESKENLTTFGSSISTMLGKASERRTESRRKLRRITDEWKSASLKTSDNVKCWSSNENNRMQEMIHLLELELKRHDDIEKELSGQHKFLAKKRAEYIDDLQTQNNSLLTQRSMFDDSRKEHKEFCQEFMSSVMRGVQELLENQMSLMEKQHDFFHTAYMEGNEELINGNQESMEKAVETLNIVGSTNSALQANTQEIRKSEETVSRALHETKNLLENIEDACEKHKSEALKLNDLVVDAMDSEGNADLFDSEEFDREVKIGVEGCISHVETQMCKPVEESLVQLADHTAAAFAFMSNEVVHGTDEAIRNSLESPLRNISEEVSEGFGTINSALNKSDKVLENICNKHCQFANALKEQTVSSSLEISRKVSKQMDEVASQKERELEYAEEHRREFSAQASEARGNASTAIEKTHHFAKKVIMADEDTPKIPKQEIPSYSESLTSTPARAIILKAAGLSSASDKENSLPHISDTATGIQNDDPKRMVLRIRTEENNSSIECDNGKASHNSKRRLDVRRENESRSKLARTLG